MMTIVKKLAKVESATFEIQERGLESAGYLSVRLESIQNVQSGGVWA